jgi:DNA-binding transcriptional LysR family regulator
MLDARRLLTFRAVAQHGSFSRAAEALALSQPAVSQQVAALERELGTALLVRGRGGTLPTDAGRLLLEHADAVAARLDLADVQMGELVAGARRTLRLGAFPSALAAVVPAAIAALRAQEPELEVAVEEGALAGIADGVRTGRLDIAVGFQDAAAPRRDHGGLRREELAEEPMLAVVGAGHRLAGRARIALEELRDDPWMAPSPDGLVVGACRAAGFEPRLVLVIRDPLAVRAIAAAGMAVTLTPRLLARLNLPGVANVPLAGGAPRRQLYALLPPAGAHERALAMVEALRAACLSDAPPAA